MPEKASGRRKGWRMRASYGPTQKLPRRWCLFGRSLTIAWAGLDGWMNSVLAGTVVTARQKKMSSVGGDTHPPIAPHPCRFSKTRESGRVTWVQWNFSVTVDMQGVAQRTNGSRPTSHTVERQVPVLCRPVEGNDSGSAYFWRPGMGIGKVGPPQHWSNGGPVCPAEAPTGSLIAPESASESDPHRRGLSVSD